MKEEHKSDCCGAEVKTVCADEGTSHWECKKCGKSCNDIFYVNDKQEGEPVYSKDNDGGFHWKEGHEPMDKQEEGIDELVRDITKVGSISKSEVRRRINDLISKDRDTLIEKINILDT